MKEVKAFIQPHVVERVVRALHELPHFPGLTVIDVVGHGRGQGEGGSFQATEDEIVLQNRKVIEVICSDDLAPTIVDAIQTHAHTGHRGDGLVTVRDLSLAIRIRTGDESDAAV